MSYWVRLFGGLALMLGSVALLGLAIYQLIDTGTCASGGPYVSAKPCPEDTGWWIAAISVSIPMFLAGGWVFAIRGRTATAPGLPPGSDSITANPRPYGQPRGRNN